MSRILDLVHRSPASAGSRPPAMTTRENVATLAVTGWLVAGLFVDGWAHNTRTKLETFFTPWHALFYSGFAATVGWIGWAILRRITVDRPPRDAVPAGYGAAVVGIAVFALSAIGDLIWHQLFGIERNVAALLSPTHLGLFTGALLIVTAPWRSETAKRSSHSVPVVAVCSATLAGSLIGFIVQDWHPLKTNPISARARADLLADHAGRGVSFVVDQQVRAGVAGFVIATICLFAPLVLLARRWPLPPWAPFVVLAGQSVLMQGLTGFADPGLAILGLVGAAAVAGVARVVRPTGPRWKAAAFAGSAPVVFWGVYVAGIGLADHHLGWKAELWGGSLVWSGLVGLALALAVIPDPAWLPPAGPNAAATTHTGTQAAEATSAPPFTPPAR